MYNKNKNNSIHIIRLSSLLRLSSKLRCARAPVQILRDLSNRCHSRIARLCVNVCFVYKNFCDVLNENTNNVGQNSDKSQR